MKWIYAKNKKHYLAMELNYSWAIGRYRKLFCFKQKTILMHILETKTY